MSADVPRRPPPGWRGGAPPPANPSLTKTGSELLRSLASVTQSVSASTRELWINPMKEIARDHSVVVVEHDMEFVKSLESKVTVLHEGSVLAEGSLETVQNDPTVIEVYLGR